MTALIPATHNTGGSLPDLTNIHFPSPLPTPLDPEEPPFPALSGSSSTGNLAGNLTHLGLGGTGQGEAAGLRAFHPRVGTGWVEVRLSAQQSVGLQGTW